MIRINLLEETRVAATKKASGGGFAMPKLEVAENVPVFLLLGGLGIAVLAVAMWGMYLMKTSRDLDAKIQKAAAEQKRLEYVLKRNEELGRRKDDLKRKIAVIGSLKAKQDLPVQLLDLVSRNLADFVWLEDMTYACDTVQLHGKAQTPIAVANFLRNLEESKFFREVSMGQVQNDPASGLTKFELNMIFNPAGQEPAPGAADAAAKPAS